jgi:hypothetical protein
MAAVAARQRTVVVKAAADQASLDADRSRSRDIEAGVGAGRGRSADRCGRARKDRRGSPGRSARGAHSGTPNTDPRPGPASGCGLTPSILATYTPCHARAIHPPQGAAAGQGPGSGTRAGAPGSMGHLPSLPGALCRAVLLLTQSSQRLPPAFAFLAPASRSCPRRLWDSPAGGC